MENKPKTNTVLLVIIIILLAIGGVYWFSKNKSEDKKIKNSSFSPENEKIINDFTLNGNNCYDRTSYFVITRADPLNGGDDILIKYRSDKNQNIACDYSLGNTDFELKNFCDDGPVCYRAQHFSSITDNLLIVDEGTGTENRNIVIYDLVKKAKVFSDTYNSSVDSIKPQGNLISYWQTTNTVANSQNCPKIKEYQNQGGGAKIETKISLDLSTLTKKELGETRCSYSQ
jgi:hypothetical protein